MRRSRKERVVPRVDPSGPGVCSRPVRRALVIALALVLASSCRGLQRDKSVASDPVRAFAEIAAAEDRREPLLLVRHTLDRDAAIRARSARALGRTGGKDAVRELIRLSKDVAPEVATEAIYYLGLLDPGDAKADARRALAGLLASEDSGLRAAAVEALGRSDDDLLISQIVPMLRDGAPVVRAEAALAAGRLLGERFAGKRTATSSQIESVVSAVGALAVKDREPHVRWRAAYALASIRHASIAAPLLEAAHDANNWARLFAIRGLGKHSDSAAVREALLASLSDTDARVACEAAVALGKHLDARAVDALGAMLDRPEVFVRRAAVRSLGSAKALADRVGPILERARLDRSDSVRAEVPLVVAKLGAENDSDLLRDWIRDPSPLVRARAAEGAAFLSLESARETLTTALRDPDGRVVAAAATALGSVRFEEARAMVQRALRHERGLVIENAASALEEWAKDPKRIVVDDVLSLLGAYRRARGEDFAEVRASILTAIETVESARRAAGGAVETRDARGVDLRRFLTVVLGDALSDPDKTVRVKAQKAWSALLAPETPPEILVPQPVMPPIPGATAAPFARNPRVRVRTTKGTFEAELFASDAPVHAENLLRLADEGFYEGTPWHRVELNFVLQGGDHLGDGTGARAALGGTLRDEINRRRFERGTIGMPKSDVPDSGGSQIFVCHLPTPHLDGRYTAFGQVIEGLEVLDRIEVGDRILAVEVLDNGR